MNHKQVPTRASTSSVSDQSGTDAFQRHGSIRKVLHSLVGNDSLLGKSAKMLDRPKTKFEDEAYSEYFREYSIIFEYNTLCDRLIPGLYVIPSANSCLTWYGVMFVRSGPYKGGVFRLTMEIPEDFPNSLPPKVFMDPGLYHPAVHPSTHELNVHDVFPRWSRTANRLWQVLEYTHSIFQQISIKCPLNKDAAELYETNKEEFNKKASECADKCAANTLSSVYHDISDAHFIRFTPFEESVHSSALAALLTSTFKSG
ncbi:hypothetical protein GE061_008948 [Apolygus lucorum]|uniref:UBC core domain-containing protein n=1 Tax=Apolygus lucorum TaxID=248454 RepID=A0A8S9Y0A7_APOLU|nr:hypothetical protein GE061_008948 [Apolygus lucorum]